MVVIIVINTPEIVLEMRSKQSLRPWTSSCGSKHLCFYTCALTIAHARLVVSSVSACVPSQPIRNTAEEFQKYKVSTNNVGYARQDVPPLSTQLLSERDYDYHNLRQMNHALSCAFSPV